MMLFSFMLLLFLFVLFWLVFLLTLLSLKLALLYYYNKEQYLRELSTFLTVSLISIKD